MPGHGEGSATLGKAWSWPIDNISRGLGPFLGAVKKGEKKKGNKARKPHGPVARALGIPTLIFLDVFALRRQMQQKGTREKCQAHNVGPE